MGPGALLLLGPLVAAVAVAAAPSNASLAAVAADAVFPYVDTACSLDVNFGARTVAARTANGPATVIGSGPPPKPPDPPVLCAWRGKPHQPALLTIATDAAYLRPFSSFLWNKLCYCGREGMSFLLFFGTISKKGTSPRCPSGRASNHWIKAVAVHAALEAGHAEVLVIDTDTFMLPDSFGHRGRLGCYFEAARSSSIVGNVVHYQALVNAAVLFFRDTPWARALLRLWWRDRCGDKDQLVLWHALLTLWTLEDPNVGYDGQSLLAYAGRYNDKAAKHNYTIVRERIVYDYAHRARPDNFKRTHVQRNTGGLVRLVNDRVLEFPGLTLFPERSFAVRRPTTPSCKLLPPLRDEGQGGFLKHTKHPPVFDCCPRGVDAGARCVW